MGKNFRIFIPIAKVNREQRTVGGWATTETIDKQDEVVDYEASKKAFDNWHGNIREMHEPKAVGKAISVQEDDENKRIYVTAKISKGAQDTWEKVKDGTLTGFSIGGQTEDKKVVLVKDDNTNEHRQVTRITKYKLNELSLVDNPANPEAQFELVKSVSGQLQQTQVIEDNATKTISKKYNGGDLEKMALSKATLTKITALVKTLETIVKEDWEDPNAEVGSAKETPHQTTEGSDNDPDENTRVGKADTGDWEDPNPEVGGAKKTPQVTTEGKELDEGDRVGKADMDTNPDSSLQTQEEDGSDAAPVTKLYKKNKAGDYEEMNHDEAMKMLKADMDTNPDSSLQTQDEDGSDAAPVKKRRSRKMGEDNHEDETEKAADEDEDVEKAHEDDHDDDTEKAYDNEEEETTKTRKVRKVKKTRKQNDEDEDVAKGEDEDEDVEKAEDKEDDEKVSKTVLSELKKISTRLDKIERTPMPRKYHKVEKGAAAGDGDADQIQKTTDEVAKATEEARITGKPCSPEIEKKREWLINKRFDAKFGTSDLRKV